MSDATISTLTHEEFENESQEYVDDLVALFSVMQDTVNELVGQAAEEGWSIDELEDKIKNAI